MMSASSAHFPSCFMKQHEATIATVQISGGTEVSECRMAPTLPVPTGTRLVAAAAGWLRPGCPKETRRHQQKGP